MQILPICVVLLDARQGYVFVFIRQISLHTCIFCLFSAEAAGMPSPKKSKKMKHEKVDEDPPAVKVEPING